MANKKKNKEFDCLEYKYKVQEQIYNEIKKLSRQEEKEYFNKTINGSFGYLFHLSKKETNFSSTVSNPS